MMMADTSSSQVVIRRRVNRGSSILIALQSQEIEQSQRKVHRSSDINLYLPQIEKKRFQRSERRAIEVGKQ